MSRVLWSLWAKVDEARLVGVEGESIACEPLAQDRQHAFGVDDVVERHQRVVGKPDKGAPPSEPRFHRSLEPFVQHVVQEDVREAGRDYTPLRGALGGVAQQTVFYGSCFQPFIDHPSDDAVCDSLVKTLGGGSAGSSRNTCVCRCRAPSKDAWPRARSAECAVPGEPTAPAGSRMSRAESPVHRFLPGPWSRRVAPPCLRGLECRAAFVSHPPWGCMLGGPAVRDNGRT